MKSVKSKPAECVAIGMFSLLEKAIAKLFFKGYDTAKILKFLKEALS